MEAHSYRSGGSLKHMWWLIEHMWWLIETYVVAQCHICHGSLLHTVRAQSYRSVELKKILNIIKSPSLCTKLIPQLLTKVTCFRHFRTTVSWLKKFSNLGIHGSSIRLIWEDFFSPLAFSSISRPPHYTTAPQFSLCVPAAGGGAEDPSHIYVFGC